MLPLVAGTFVAVLARGMDSSLDYLFIDEAGQVSLADAIAMGTAARKHRPARRSAAVAASASRHPSCDSGRSVVEHLLAGRATVPEHHGVFLSHTWRMHPTCARSSRSFSYDGRLTSAEGRDRQRIASFVFDGTGLRFLAVDMRATRRRQWKRQNAVAAAVRGLLDGGMFTDIEGRSDHSRSATFWWSRPTTCRCAVFARRCLPGSRSGPWTSSKVARLPSCFFSMASSSG
jgi:uncharacterized protein